LEDFSKFYAAGITTFDCADHYGPAEVLLGRWMQQVSQATGTDLRSRVQVRAPLPGGGGAVVAQFHHSVVVLGSCVVVPSIQGNNR
jgi:hypothetical protein